MKARVRRYHSPDVENLESWSPDDTECFGFLLQVFVGPRSGRGEESFDFIVCTPEWLKHRYDDQPVTIVRNHILVSEYNFPEIRGRIDRLVERMEADTWKELAERLSRYGRWEFEDCDSELG